MPNQPWEFGIKHQTEAIQFSSRGRLNKSTASKAVTGKTPDISEYLDFDFYNLVWYFTGVHPSISGNNCLLGIWLGVSHQIGSGMCYWIMKKIGVPIAETTVKYVTKYNILDADKSNQITQFSGALDTNINNSDFLIAIMDDFTF